MAAGFVVFLALQSLIVLQVVLAYHDKFLLVSQLSKKSIPLIWHLGIWSDALLLSYVAAQIVSACSPSWKQEQMQIAALFAAIAVAGFTFMWWLQAATIHVAHVHDGRITGAGWAHTVYFLVVLSILVLFYFYSGKPSHEHLILVAVVLTIHLPAANGLLLDFVGLWVDQEGWRPPHPLRDTSLGWAVSLGIVGGVWVRTYQLW